MHQAKVSSRKFRRAKQRIFYLQTFRCNSWMEWSWGNWSEGFALTCTLSSYQYILKQDLEFRLPGVAEQLIEKLQKQKKEFCIIKDGTEQVKLLYKDILYLYKSKGAKYVDYVTTQGVVRERTSLENALKMLNNKQFLLVERGYAVNIKQICRVSGDTIYLEKGYEVPVSKARLAEVKREINLYWRNS